MVTRKAVQEFVRRSEMQDAVVCLHSSLKSFAELENGAHTIIDGFLDAGCTLVCPAFYYQSHAFPPGLNYERNGIDFSHFDHLPEQSYNDENDQIEKAMGLVPRTMLGYPQAIRTKNPLNAFVVLGPLAPELVAEPSLLNAYSVYKAIHGHRAWVVLAGVDFTSCTPIHYAEELAGRRLFRRWAIFHHQRVEVEVGACSDGFEAIGPYTKPLERVETLGASTVRIYPFGPFLTTVADLIRNNPEVTACHDPRCPRCPDMVAGGRLE